MRKKIFKVVAARPGEATRSLEEAVKASEAAGIEEIRVPEAVVFLTVPGGRIELEPTGGAQ